ncbi:uncharacterized protein LOC141538290 [Cotesia typhae]|uniref:uncharacterized protein LOC141538290 n=1 Tax=Cotesia typhae TaxID=2053667 RepID=UPI003D6986EA
MTQTIEFLESLGFIINHDKSKLVPEKKCKYLGFILDSNTMRIELPQEKKFAIQKQIENLKGKKMLKIRDFAKVVGVVFDAFMSVPKYTLKDWDWWLKVLPKASRKVRNTSYEKIIYSDFSLSGWGAFCDGESANGLWSQDERNLHINHLELKAALLALKCFASDLRDTDVLLMVDNTTTLAYINKMGGVRYSALHELACELWNWCEVRRLWVYASYIPSEENVEADYSSRIDNSDTEWELANYAFEMITKKFGNLEIDLFASRINTKCTIYCSWKRDPEAFAFDAFTICWSNWMFYAFPPFSVITKNTSTSTSDEAYPGCRQVISQALLIKGTPKEAINISIASLAESTLKNYNGTLKLWWRWNQENDEDPYAVSVEKVLKFLSERFSSGIGYSTLNSARAALSLISSEDITNNQLISRFIKGSSKIRPSFPKYESTWDVDPALNKLTTYLMMTSGLRGNIDSLFISFNKPHKAVKSETISRWIKTTLEELGVDKRFTAHSTRHASTSKAYEKGVSIEEIKKVAVLTPSTSG